MNNIFSTNHNPGPIFILGNPRSGTTLLRLILNAHSKIFIPPECGFAIWLSSTYQNWTREDTNGKRLDIFLNDLSKAKKFETWEISENALKNYIYNVQPCSYNELASSVYCFYSITHHIEKKIWGDKNNFYIQHVPDIRKIFPNARFVLIIRDGRDVATSYIKLTKEKINSKYAPRLSADMSDIAKEWYTNNLMAINSLRLNSSSYIIIRYEDLVCNSASTLNEVCRTLDLNYEENMLNYYLEAESNEPSEFFQWKHKNKHPIDNKSIGQYKNALSKQQISEFNLISEKLLREFNYI